MFRRAVAFIIVALLLLGLLIYGKYRREPYHISGFVEGHTIRVGSLVGGRLSETLAVEGEQVKQGQPLARFDPYDLPDQRRAAEAELGTRQADLDRLEAGFRLEEIAQAEARVEMFEAALAEAVHGPRPEEIDQAEAMVRQAEAQLKMAQSDFARIQVLVKEHSATQQSLDRATEALAAGRANLDVRQKSLELLQKGTRQETIDQAQAQLKESQSALKLMRDGYRVEDIEKARQARDAAQAQLAAIDARIEELTVRAPLDATVQAFQLRSGALLGPGMPVLELLDTRELWVRAFTPEDRLGMKLGTKVWVTVDSFPGESFEAEITFVADEAEFTPNNVQTPEDRSKQVFRVKATLREGLDRLRPGMAADVWLKKPSEDDS